MTQKRKPFSHSAKALRRKSLAGSTKRLAASSSMPAKIRATIKQIPRGKVSTYGEVARAAGFPGAARQVPRALHSSVGLPWQRVLGSGGEIKLRGESALEQRFRLEAEGVRFRGKKVDMKTYEFHFTGGKSRG
jgi:methylated-DNA-protein-cysteine methyltransferase related protein